MTKKMKKKDPYCWHLQITCLIQYLRVYGFLCFKRKKKLKGFFLILSATFLYTVKVIITEKKNCLVQSLCVIFQGKKIESIQKLKYYLISENLYGSPKWPGAGVGVGGGRGGEKNPPTLLLLKSFWSLIKQMPDGQRELAAEMGPGLNLPAPSARCGGPASGGEWRDLRLGSQPSWWLQELASLICSKLTRK